MHAFQTPVGAITFMHGAITFIHGAITFIHLNIDIVLFSLEKLYAGSER